MPLADEFKRFKNKPGVYIISETSSPTTKMDEYVCVKIGKSESNLNTRLNSFHTAYKESFYTYSICVTESAYGAKKLEKEIHSHLKKLGYQYKPRFYLARNSNRGNEWYEAKRKGDLIDAINHVLKNTTIKMRIYNLHEKYFKLTK